MPKMIFMFPIMVLLVFPWAASYEISNLNLSVIDNDHSRMSHQLVEAITASGYFKITNVSNGYNDALKSIEKNESDLVIEIPQHFEKDITTGTGVKVMISANAVNGMKGSVGMTYISGIISNFNQTNLSKQFPQTAKSGLMPIQIDEQYRFNKHLNYQVFMVPALMVMILTLVCGFFPAASIVFEKELGTMEQMNVTPVPKFTFIIAKLIPYWIVGIIAISIGVIISWLVYGLIPAGHFYVLYGFTIVYVFGISGLGIIISNYAHTMQQAFFIVFFFMMIFIMLSGLYTPVQSMPEWAQWIAAFNPLKHLTDVMRAIYLKGSGFGGLLKELIVLIAFAVFFNTWAVISYRKTQ
jgi:ABC-2 type transport system permease protein